MAGIAGGVLISTILRILDKIHICVHFKLVNRNSPFSKGIIVVQWEAHLLYIYYIIFIFITLVKTFLKIKL